MFVVFEDGAARLHKNFYSIISPEMIAGTETQLFEGEDGKEKIPKYSLNELGNGLSWCIF